MVNAEAGSPLCWYVLGNIASMQVTIHLLLKVSSGIQSYKG